MIEFEQAFYTSPYVASHKKDICVRLKRGEMVIGYFALYINPETGMPESIPSYLLQTKYYKRQKIRIIGLAENYDYALRYLAHAAGRWYGK